MPKGYYCAFCRETFDEQEIQILQIPICQRIPDHGRLKMTDCAGDDLLHRYFVARQALSIIFRGQVAEPKFEFWLVAQPALQTHLSSSLTATLVSR